MKHIKEFESTIRGNLKTYVILHIKLFNQISEIKLIYITKQNIEELYYPHLPKNSFISEELYEYNFKLDKISKTSLIRQQENISNISTIEKYIIYQSDDFDDCFEHFKTYINLNAKLIKYNL
jgi:hypothetical protein